MRRQSVSPDARAGYGETTPMEQHPLASPNLGLDVNLDDLSEFSAFETSLPEVSLAADLSTKEIWRRDDGGKNSNLIDFELLDPLTSPDEVDPKGSPGGQKP